MSEPVAPPLPPKGRWMAPIAALLAILMWPVSLIWCLVAIGEELNPEKRAAYQADKKVWLFQMGMVLLALLAGSVGLSWRGPKSMLGGLAQASCFVWTVLVIALFVWAR